jgi:ParB family chromosome partitioning protein
MSTNLIETGEMIDIPPRQITRARTWTGDTEWYTPPYIIEAAAAVMGGIDLDPATSEAQQACAPVKAANYFTIKHSGLNRPWRGRVFLNPPYARSEIDRFVTKMVAAYQARELQQGILLTNSSTDTKWWQFAYSHCNALCFLRKRVRFLKVANGTLTRGKSSPSHGHSIFYFGADVTRFAQVFSAMGLVAQTKR